MKISIKKISGNWAVIVESGRASGIYFQGHGLAAAKHAAAVLRRDVKQHGEAVINFDALEAAA